MSSKMRGEVKFYKDGTGPGCGFGFIYPKNDQGQYHKKGGGMDEFIDAAIDPLQRTEMFFHLTGIKDNLFVPQSRDEVLFDIAEGERGQMADQIELVRAAREKNRTSLVASNVTIGVPKTDLKSLTEMLGDIKASVDTGKTVLPPGEKEILSRHLKSLKNVYDAQHENQRHDDAPPVMNGASNKKDRKNKGASATAA